MAPPLASAAAVIFAAALMVASSQAAIGLPSCATKCGNVSVPYPFGLGPARCSWPGFNLTCDATSNRLLLRGGDDPLVVDDISLQNATVRVLRTSSIINTTSGDTVGGPYTLSARNEFILFGCDVQAELLGVLDRDAGGGGNTTTTISRESITSSCASICSDSDDANAPAGNGHAAGGSSKKKFCSGEGCCQAPISGDSTPTGLLFTRLQAPNGSRQQAEGGGAAEVRMSLPVFAYVMEEGWIDPFMAHEKSLSDREQGMPLVLRWAVRQGLAATSADKKTCPGDVARRLCKSELNDCRREDAGGYTCHCKRGYDGNPYLNDGCQDINECELREIRNSCFGECKNFDGSYECRCPRGSHGNHTIPNGCVRSITGLSIGIGTGCGAGIILFVLIAVLMTQKFKHRRKMTLKQKYFKQNRGQLLQQLVSQKADIAERMIITVYELAKATNNFDKARELGGGGHGTIYKGILSDLQVVAIKKSKIAVQKEIDEFINEVAILSQINHRNVVKLLGCCLETEVPLLVYEFISSGTLYHHLHVKGQKSLSWRNRLRIATEIANALSYLHSFVSVPIIHRDIKSSNILLDDTLTSKVSDFGASRYIPMDKTGLTTKVQGTIGYLDPAYFYTGRLTEKSDVYSFGVILVKLLTGKKPFSFLSPDGEGLVAHFVNLLTEDNLVEILDRQVLEEGNNQEIHEVAILAALCVKLGGEERPTMRQVEHTLEGLQSSERSINNDSTVVQKSDGDGIVGTNGFQTKE